MPGESIFILSFLTLKREGVPDYQSFTSSAGDEIKVIYEPVHGIYETAERTIRKVLVGYRVKIIITTYISPSTCTKADFLARAINSERVQIFNTQPSENLEGLYLVIEKVEPVETWTIQKYMIRAEGVVESLVTSMPETS